MLARRDLEVPSEHLCNVLDPDTLGFETTDDVPPLEGTVGQDRAVAAIEFGLRIDTDGYNLFVTGAPGTGRNTTVLTYLRSIAPTQPVPPDLCYVYNFQDAYRPHCLSLPAGVGSQFARDMEEFIDGARREIPRAFESENYEERKAEGLKDIQERREALSAQLQGDALQRGFTIEATPVGIVTVPLVGGKPMSREEYARLSDERKQELQALSQQLQSEMEQILREGRKLEKESAERIRQLDREIAIIAIGPLLEDLLHRYAGHPRVQEYLSKAQEDIVERLEDFRGREEQAVTIPGLGKIGREPSFDRYKVNVIVSNRDTQGAPIIIEHNPTYYNLIGRIDYRAQLGAVFTDFNMIKAGALHRANGGYLLVQARDVLTSLLAWDALKRSLRSKEVRIENLGEQYSAIPTATLRPESIPVAVKVVMVGSPYIYYLLYYLDEDFRKLFKVKADFDVDMKRTDEHVAKYAAFISALCRRSNLKQFDKSGVARVVDYGSRLQEAQHKLSTRFLDIGDIVAEASYWASQNGNHYVMAEDVDKAIAEKEFRSNLIESRVHELIDDGTLLIDTVGSVVGQVNGLSIASAGDYYFGRPSRITARIALGNAGVLDIQREIKLSGPIHSKGVLILSGYLTGKYAQDKPLTLSASLAFEQMYDEIEGDSASSTELYCLLSTLAELPMRQDIAVTGSVNQLGEIQPVGGVTRKVEGFFEACKIKGLTGQQGVIVPATNVKNLMLKEEVVAAARQGKFHIYAVKTVDEGIEILTGVPAGELKNGAYPQGTVNFLVNRRLMSLAQKAREFGRAMGRNNRRKGTDEKEA